MFVLSVLPPFEGWDEYQHIAYIVYLKEEKALPRFGTSTVPRSMIEMLQRYPHSNFDNEQNSRWGTRTYKDFWTVESNEIRNDQRDIGLYQAQQAPLYYLVALPFWLIFYRRDDEMKRQTPEQDREGTVGDSGGCNQIERVGGD